MLHWHQYNFYYEMLENKQWFYRGDYLNNLKKRKKGHVTFFEDNQNEKYKHKKF
jgi:hypothetical protein